jgi:hypothetical protein
VGVAEDAGGPGRFPALLSFDELLEIMMYSAQADVG